jgi:hypothetical protein
MSAGPLAPNRSAAILWTPLGLADIGMSPEPEGRRPAGTSAYVVAALFGTLAVSSEVYLAVNARLVERECLTRH